ncbi:MAG: hypothetical protein KIT42_14920 [Rhodocyclaceae bacterium]|nr:hypothetical protein [Rhodocyclaceae bacterium]MCA9232768.1 hypothetical protein [Planctomycetales bacterium]MCW5597167.1 hypothetical protein [Rhodocyclaceae bacterium]
MSLSKEEVYRTLEQLPDDDYERIRIRARTLVRGLVSMSAEDLIQETFTALLGQDRVFPRDVDPVIVVCNAMHSEASNLRSREKTGAIDQHVEVSEITNADEGEDTVVSVVPRNEVTPERIVSNQELFSQLTDSLASEPELQDLAIAWAMELRGQEAADYLEWDMKVYEAARKRLYRRLEEVKENIK